MTTISRFLCLAAVLGLTACANPDRFSDAGNTVILTNQQGLGNVPPSADPSSPAYFSQTVGDRVLFAVDQSTLSPTARTTLDGQANWLLDNQSYNILVEGHADEQGTREYNLALSAKRASAVQQYLVARGVSAARIKTIPYGKERPIEICSDESCYAKNRRAVTVLNAGLSS